MRANINLRLIYSLNFISASWYEDKIKMQLVCTCVSSKSRTLAIYVVKWIQRVNFEKSCRNLINHSKIKMRKCEMQRVKGVNWEDRATSSLSLLRMKVDFKRVSHRRVIVSRISDVALRCVEIVERDPLHRFLIVKRFRVSSAARKLVSWLSILSFPSFFLFFYHRSSTNPIFRAKIGRIFVRLTSYATF